ncbi:PaaX family transcriptional regulator C-terminal domain-containing protein [Streptomyces sp. NPDC002680]|uniref:PaaX family transcriptional regulator n=1 Tax=Streptomyces sp. NPDC002680 TaxID=3364659 RepID=UPI0036AB6454
MRMEHKPVTAGAAGDGAVIADFPRPAKGSSTQHLLITLLTDFWLDSAEWIPSRLIVALAADLEVTPSAATSALSRLASRGVLEQSSVGRSSRYRLTDNARARLVTAVDRVFAFGTGTAHWDGSWTVIAFTIQETSRDVRELFRRHLKWRGFAPVYGALWVSPREDPKELERACGTFGVTDYVIFRTADSALHGKKLIEAWPLDELTRPYEPFIDRFAPWMSRTATGDITPEEAFRVRVQLMDTWRMFPWSDADLPLELLPERRQLTMARNLFADLCMGLADRALEHVQTHAARHAPDLSPSACLRLPGSDRDGTSTDPTPSPGPAADGRM